MERRNNDTRFDGNIARSFEHLLSPGGGGKGAAGEGRHETIDIARNLNSRLFVRGRSLVSGGRVLYAPFSELQHLPVATSNKQLVVLVHYVEV